MSILIKNFFRPTKLIGGVVVDIATDMKIYRFSIIQENAAIFVVQGTSFLIKERYLQHK